MRVFLGGWLNEENRHACRKKGVDQILEIIIFGLICFGVGLTTGIAIIFTILKKAMGMFKGGMKR